MSYPDFNYDLLYEGFGENPAPQRMVGFGYDQDNYISTAKLVPAPYVTLPLIAAKIGMSNLISGCDDSNPPVGNLDPTLPGGPIPNPAYSTYLAIIQNVVTEINGYLYSVYPCPLAQTGTVAVIKVTGLSTDGNNSVTSIEVVYGGNYNSAPSVDQTPAYLRYLDPLANVHCFGELWQTCQTGTGLVLTVAYQNVNYSDESGQVLQASTINGTPVITNGGSNYNCGDVLVLVGGSSFVPAKVRQATLDLICHTLYKRRLSPDEKNPFSALAKMWRDFFIEIGEGTKQLDGTYKRFYSNVTAWTQRSVVFGANSL